jgi:hypothetical protein
MRRRACDGCGNEYDVAEVESEGSALYGVLVGGKVKALCGFCVMEIEVRDGERGGALIRHAGGRPRTPTPNPTPTPALPPRAGDGA